MKASEIRQMTQGEVDELLGDRLEELSNLRIQLVTQQLDNPLRVKSVRRDIARIRTVLRERALELNASTGAAGTESTGSEGN
ncbi:MAG: 50S ribosomal protein L29 [Gemmatimonadetes bacterium]|nr:50S ribosomal protein L29 [Gemmatimonadota bacterium]MDE3257051.1 50S ribosomal protein L29 [Gemmatimonadota bacterium]